MRILVIDLDAPVPDPHFQSATHHLARLWSELGHSVTFVAASPAAHPNSIPSSKTAGLRYVLLKSPPVRKSTLWKALDLLAARFSLTSIARKVLAPEKPDVVLAASKLQMDNYAATYLVRATGAIFVRHTEHLLTLTLTQLSASLGHKPPQPWFKLLQHAERVAYHHAHMVATTFPSSFDYMQKQGLDRERWIYLPHDDLRTLAPLYLRMFTELRSHK